MRGVELGILGSRNLIAFAKFVLVKRKDNVTIKRNVSDLVNINKKESQKSNLGKEYKK